MSAWLPGGFTRNNCVNFPPGYARDDGSRNVPDDADRNGIVRSATMDTVAPGTLAPVVPSTTRSSSGISFGTWRTVCCSVRG